MQHTPDAVVSIIGSGSAEAALSARALLAGNGVAHRWLDVDSDPIAACSRSPPVWAPSGPSRCSPTARS